MRALRNRADLALQEGRYAQGLVDAREATALAVRDFGADDFESTTSAAVLGLALVYAGRPDRTGP